jgi:Domain of unknown function (DUF4253)
MIEMDDLERRQRLPAGLRHLFADGGGGRTLTAPLPPGSLVWPDPGYRQHQTAKRPAFWLSDEPAGGGEWARLRAEHDRSGLWPVLLDDSTQPWSAGQVAPEPVAGIDDYDPEAFLSEVWEEYGSEDLEPFGPHCPGLAPPAELQGDPGIVADWYSRILAGRRCPLGLAAVERGADLLAAIGWQGALNHNEWTAPLAAVVRSWEERFGVRVVGLGFNTLDVSVAAPPVTTRHAQQVAAEHWAFCPETIFQGPGTLTGYAEQIKGKNWWSFWWD